MTVEQAARALAVDREAAAKALSRWQHQGWLKRVGRGLYAPIPLEASTTAQVLDDPWVLVPALFDPGYIGGWTAAGHWDFTEQLFRSVFVFTAHRFRRKNLVVQHVPFTLKLVPESALFGLKAVWRGRVRISISDKHRTIVDLLADPATGGGIRHAAQCLMNYLGDAEADPKTLLAYADRLGNGAVFKRLGFLLPKTPANEHLVQACRERLTKGNAKLDPGLPCPRLVKEWRLWIPNNWERAGTE